MAHRWLHSSLLSSSRQLSIAKAIRGKIPLAVLLLFCAAVPPSAAQEQPARDGSSALPRRIEGLIAGAGIKGKLGIAIVDAGTGQKVFGHNADLPLNPASNVKLITAAVALLELGADFCMRTGIYGQIEGDAVRGGLYLKGFADPSLRLSDLVELARALRSRGVLSVDDVLVDDSYLDDQILPPAFDQKSRDTSAYRAAVGAVSVEQNAYLLRVRPGSAAGSRAMVHLDIPGYFELDNQLTTGAQGPPSVIAVQNPGKGKLELLLKGNVPLSARQLSYRRRVADPSSYAGYAMVEALRAVRISAPRRTRTEKIPRGMPLLASRCSPPLGQILTELGKQSDNFTAEMVLKVLGAERVKRPGTSADGAKVALNALGRMGVETDAVTMVNGSGLFAGNLFSASSFCRLLAAVHANAAIRPDFLAHLAVGGVDGTLAGRLRELPMPGVVRAKTGTLNEVISLSGYVLGPSPERVIAFSVLVNGVKGQRQAARQLADDVATAIARHLWSEGS